MNATLLEPLTPVDCDLRDFAFMPLDVVRLRDSDLSIQSTGEEFRAAVLLWCAAWHQIPAASLPNDERTLAQLAGFGRVVTEWKKVREGALRGWIECADGRLYHPVVAEKARDAWIAKLKQRFKTECARIKKHCQRHEIPYAEPDFDEWVDAGCPQGQTAGVPRTKQPRHEDKPTASPRQSGVVPRENDSKGQGEGEGQGQGQGEFKTVGTVVSPGNPAHQFDDFRPKDAAEWLSHFKRKHGFEADPTNVNDRKKLWPVFAAWTNAGLTTEFVDAAVTAAQQRAREPIACLPLYVDRLMASEQAARANPQMSAKDESRRRAYEILTGKTAQPEPLEVINGHAKLLG